MNEALRTLPDGVVELSSMPAPQGLDFIDSDDPAMPFYTVLANLRTPVALRDMMIIPVRRGYIGSEGKEPDPAVVPKSGVEAVPDVSADVVYLPVDGGALRCQLYRPTRAPPDAQLPVIVYYHGGGFMIGQSEDTDYVTRKLALTNNALVVSANYRMAPEFPFPIPLDDAMAVYRWVSEHADQLDGDATRLAVAGDSAGSNFAAAIPLRAREEGARVPDAVILLGAFCDLRVEQYESYQRMAPRGVVYDTAFIGFARGAYVPTADWAHPWVSPIAGDLQGYPTTIIATGTHDPLIDSAKAFAELVEKHGGRVHGYYPEGMPHGFYFWPDIFEEGEQVYRRVQQALREVFG